MSYTPISAGIVTLLQGIAAIKGVFNYPFDPFQETDLTTEWPIAIVIESGNENDYLSSKSNLRVFAYKIVLCAAGMNADKPATLASMRSIMDTIIDTVDVNGASATPLSNSCLWVEPVPGVFLTQGRSGNMFEMISEVTLKCYKDKTIV